MAWTWVCCLYIHAPGNVKQRRLLRKRSDDHFKYMHFSFTISLAVQSNFVNARASAREYFRVNMQTIRLMNLFICIHFSSSFNFNYIFFVLFLRCLSLACWCSALSSLPFILPFIIRSGEMNAAQKTFQRYLILITTMYNEHRDGMRLDGEWTDASSKPNDDAFLCFSYHGLIHVSHSNVDRSMIVRHNHSIIALLHITPWSTQDLVRTESGPEEG